LYSFRLHSCSLNKYSKQKLNSSETRCNKERSRQKSCQKVVKKLLQILSHLEKNQKKVNRPENKNGNGNKKKKKKMYITEAFVL
jgi:hypothetical protein